MTQLAGFCLFLCGFFSASTLCTSLSLGVLARLCISLSVLKFFFTQCPLPPFT